MPDAAELTRWTGTAVAVVGAVVVSPAASKLALATATAPARRAARMGLSWLRRLTPWLPWPVRSVTVQGSAACAVGGAGTGTLTFTGRAWGTNGSTESKVEQLHKEVEELQRLQADHQVRTAQRLASHDKELTELSQRLDGGLTDVQERQDKAERRAIETDARALPMVGVGVVLSSIPGVLAWLPFWALLPLLAGIVTAALTVTYAAWGDRTPA